MNPDESHLEPHSTRLFLYPRTNTAQESYKQGEEAQMVPWITFSTPTNPQLREEDVTTDTAQHF